MTGTARRRGAASLRRRTTSQPATGQTADGSLPLILAAIDNALRNGSYMTGGNLAFDMLCDRLGVDRGRLVFQPDWSFAERDVTPGGDASAGSTADRPG